jgi:solute carrier family 25 (mitochondrial aspartate/glutamate transporter), member 12/13
VSDEVIRKLIFLLSASPDSYQYPGTVKQRHIETALTSRPDELSQVRARNALKILLDVHGDFGRRVAGSSGGISLARPESITRSR